MIKTNYRYLSPSQCKYKFGGTNLHEFRRARLRKIANSLNLPLAADDGREFTHNDLLGRIIHRLDQLQAPEEITELQSQSKAEKPAEKKPAKKRAKKKK